MQKGANRQFSWLEYGISDEDKANEKILKHIDENTNLEVRKLEIDLYKIDLERRKLSIEITKIKSENWHKESAITNQFATIAIRNAILINGAAAAATLTYMGNLAKNNNVTATNQVNLFTNNSTTWGLLAFAIGVFTASMCATFAYATRTAYSGKGSQGRLSFVFEIFSWIFGFSALFCFPIGCVKIAESLGFSILTRNY